MTSVATVVAVGGSYGRWLPGWADAIVGQTRLPEQAALVDNGCADPSAIEDAAGRLRAAGIDVRTATLPWTVNWGRARNLAVDLTDTVWVSHVDADDVLMPHALADWQQLEADADVVAFGWERLGGKPFTRIYRPSHGRTMRRTSAPASAVSPFRRELWQQSPYYDGLSSGWDTGLWRGFGWLDAQVVPTSRPCYWYRWHPNSIFNRRKASGDPDGVGRRLHQLATCPPADVAVIVPWRDSGCSDRRSAWRWLQRRWATLHPDWQLVQADCDGPWSKPRAVNGAVERTDAKVLVVADADCTVDSDTLRWATLDAAVYPWVIPHGDVIRLDEATSRMLTDGPADAGLPARTSFRRYRAFPGGGLFVISKAQWQAVGGFDVRFSGWGCEDEAFACAADTLLGPHVRYEDQLLVHLWHPPGLRSDDPKFAANRSRFDEYRRLSGDRAAMAAHVEDHAYQPS